MGDTGQYITAVPENGPLYRSTNYGITWTAVGPTEPWVSIFISPNGQHQIAGTNRNGVYISTDYGETWQHTLTNALSQLMWVCVTIDDMGNCIAGGNDIIFYKTNNFFYTWIAVDIAYTNADAVVSSDVTITQNNQTIAHSRGLLVTNNLWQTYRDVSFALCKSVSVTSFNGGLQVLVTGTGANEVRITDDYWQTSRTLYTMRSPGQQPRNGLKIALVAISGNGRYVMIAEYPDYALLLNNVEPYQLRSGYLKEIPYIVAWPTVQNTILLGQSLHYVNLSGGSVTTPGTFSFIDPSIVPPSGTSTQLIQFIPTDTDTYATRTNTVLVTVVDSTPIIYTWPTVAYVYPCGRLLASIELSGGVASVPGTFAFADPTIKPPNGTSQQAVIFTPTDTVTYYSITGSISVTTYCSPCDDDRGKPNAYGADHESIRVRKRIDACACCRGGYAGAAPTVVEPCTKCDITTSSQPPPNHAHSEHHRMMRELVACPLYEKTYTLDIVCDGIVRQNPYVRYEYRTYDRITGIEEVADTVRGISSSEITTRRRRTQEASEQRSQRRHAEHFRSTPPAPPCRPPQVGPQPGVPIAPVTPCNPGTQRVDYSIPNR